MKNAAAFESSTPLFSEDELRTLLTNAAPSSPPVTLRQPTHFRRNIMIGSGVLAGACAAFVLYSTMLHPPAEKLQLNREQSIVSTQTPLTEESGELNTQGIVSPSSDKQTNPSLAFIPPPAMPTGTADESQRDVRSSVSVVVPPNSATVPSKIKGLKALELSIQELSELGIRVSGEGYQVNTELGYDANDPVSLQAFASNNGRRQIQTSFKQQQLEAVLKSFGYESRGRMKFSVQLDSFSLRSTLQQASAESPKIAPLLITHEVADFSGVEQNSVLLFGNSDYSAAQNGTAMDESAQLYDLYSAKPQARVMELRHFPLLSKLIAVRLPLLNRKGVGADVVLWYYPTESFINALPSKYGEAIREEIERLAAAEQQGITPSKPGLDVRPQGEYRYTDVVRSMSGSVEILSIGPNPASEQATLRYRVTDERSLSIALYDMGGNRVAVLGSMDERPKGDYSETLDCRSLPSGAYLLSVVTNRGEQAIQRFIIQK